KIENLLFDIPAGTGGEALDRRVAGLSNTMAAYVEHMEDLDRALAAHPSTTGAKQLAKLELELRDLEAALGEAEEERRLRDEGLIRDRAERLHAMVVEAREAGEAFADRGPVNAALKVLF